MQTDNHWASRYLITFESAAICNEWWSLVESEYPSQGVRHGPQLFSFQGDNFPSKPANNKKFDDLKTKWLYTQFGDATGTGGRGQDILPLQDWNGRILNASGSPSGTSNPAQNPPKGKEKAASSGDDDDEDKERSKTGRFDTNALLESLQSMHSMVEMNNAQIAQLTESQARDQERVERAETVLEENARQLQDLTRAHMKAQRQTQELAEQNAKLIRELRRQRTTAAKPPPLQLQQEQQQQETGQGEQKGSVEKEKEKEKESKADKACAHNVRPPPRKLDKQLVGYAYEKTAQGKGKAQKRGNPLRRTVSSQAH